MLQYAPCSRNWKTLAKPQLALRSSSKRTATKAICEQSFLSFLHDDGRARASSKLSSGTKLNYLTTRYVHLAFVDSFNETPYF